MLSRFFFFFLKIKPPGRAVDILIILPNTEKKMTELLLASRKEADFTPKL